MPGTHRTKMDAYRQLAAIERHDDPQHFAEALGARPKPKSVQPRKGGENMCPLDDEVGLR